MRVISQDGTLDIPYEDVIIQRFESRIYFLNKNLTGVEPLNNDMQIAEYSTEEKAKKAMELLRFAYENNEFYHHTGNSELFAEVYHTLSQEEFNERMSEYFQFPTEEELE